MAKTIRYWNTRENRYLYLYRLRPTRFTNDISLCLKLADQEAAKASSWLTLIGINHEIVDVEGNH